MVTDLLGNWSPLGDWAARGTAAAAGNFGAAMHGVIAAENTNANTGANTSEGAFITCLVSIPKQDLRGWERNSASHTFRCALRNRR